MRTPETPRDVLPREPAERCNRCGGCIAVCPVYEELRIETYGPRGKIELAARLASGELDMSRRTGEILSSCLLCGRCVRACPVGVHGPHIFTDLRRTYTRSMGMDWRKALLFKLMRHPDWMRRAVRIVRLGRDTGSGLLERAATERPHPPLPDFNERFFGDHTPSFIPASGRRLGRVAYFYGCATHFFFGETGRKTVRLLAELGMDVVIPPDQMCCGMPMFTAGHYEDALYNIQRNLRCFAPLDVDALIVDCPTCGLAFKSEIPFLLERSGEAPEQALDLARKTRDVHEFLAERVDGLRSKPSQRPLRAAVTYHDPCHLLQAQGIGEEPRAVLGSREGLEVREMFRADACCGGGGAFQMDEPDLSKSITQKKVQSILDTGAGIVATPCPSCRITLSRALQAHPVRVVHPVDILVS